MRAQIPHRWRPSPNVEPRRGGLAADLVILHYTGMTSAEGAVDWLVNPAAKVSCHYLVDETGAVTQMVEEHMRAWHAGVSCWQGASDVNSRSIGIEIHNSGHELGYEDFPDAQVEAVAGLCRDILSRHRIAPEAVLAHSDVAPGRKIDPGEKFPWDALFEAGVGHWVPPVPLGEAMPEAGAIARLGSGLAAYGYCIDPATVDARSFQTLVAAFQRHFRPARVDGIPDASTFATLERLLAALSAPSPAVLEWIEGGSGKASV